MMGWMIVKLMQFGRIIGLEGWGVKERGGGGGESC